MPVNSGVRRLERHMGVTVHFEGSLASEGSLKRVVEIAQAFASARDWSVAPIEEAKVKLQRVRCEEDWDYEGPTRGIALQPHANSDPLRLEFDSELYVQEYCKTQFAPLAIHVQVIELLRSIQSEFVKLTVEDEGEYWETSEESRLAEHLNVCFTALDEHIEKDPTLMGPVRAPSGRILDLVSRE